MGDNSADVMALFTVHPDGSFSPQLVRRYVLPVTGRAGILCESVDGEITYIEPDAPPPNPVSVAAAMSFWGGTVPVAFRDRRTDVLAAYTAMYRAWLDGVAAGGLGDERNGLFTVVRREVCGCHRYKAAAVRLVRSPGSFTLVAAWESLDGEWVGVHDGWTDARDDPRRVVEAFAGRMPADDLLDCRSAFAQFTGVKA